MPAKTPSKEKGLGTGGQGLEYLGNLRWAASPQTDRQTQLSYLGKTLALIVPVPGKNQDAHRPLFFSDQLGDLAGGGCVAHLPRPQFPQHVTSRAEKTEPAAQTNSFPTVNLHPRHTMGEGVVNPNAQG